MVFRILFWVNGYMNVFFIEIGGRVGLEVKIMRLVLDYVEFVVFVGCFCGNIF